ncbi:hypothetical protein MMC13_005446 [Lambiella insularis]|nr:hypothetical protein [Lambiella insularis]
MSEKGEGEEEKQAEKPETPEKIEPEQDLTTFLDDVQCADFTLLISTITERMRQSILSNFDPSAGLNKDLIGDSSKSEDEKILNPDLDLSNVDVGAYDAEKKKLAEREKQLSEPKLKKLKEDSLKNYDQWRKAVVKRAAEAVHSKQEVEKLISEAANSDGTSLLSSRTQEQKGSLTEGKIERSAPKLEDVFPRVKTPLTKLSLAKRNLVLHSVLLLLISLENYSARSRVLLLFLSSSLKLGLRALSVEEQKVAKGLLESAQQINVDEEAQNKVAASEKSRKWKMAAATAAGAAVIGVSGGMAAPMIASGVGAMMGGLGLGATAAAGYLGSVAGSTYLVGALFGAYGGKMTGEMMDNLSREVEDFAFLPVHGRRKEFTDDNEAAGEERRLRVTIGITGWLTEKEEIVKPWRILNTDSEVFAVRWELETLMNLGNSMNTMLSSAAWGYAQSQVIQRTIFAELMSSMIWPMGLVKVARVVDNPFTLAKSRADKAGEILADALIRKAQGERSVTLIGYSMGARLIYACLISLAKREAFGLVESAILIGAPTPSDTADWRLLRTACAGRLINVYSERDRVLAFLYRTSSIQYGVAGLSKIEGLPGVENVDVSETVTGHLRYRFLIGKVLQKIGLQDLDKAELKNEEVAFEKMLAEEKEQDLIRQAKEKSQAYLGRKDVSDKDAEKEASNMEEEIEHKNQQSMMQWASEQLYISRDAKADPDQAAGLAAKVIRSAANAADDAAVEVSKRDKTYYQYAKDKMYLYSSGSKNEHLAKEGISEVGPGYMTQVALWAAQHLPSWHSTKVDPNEATKGATDTAKGAADTVTSTANEAKGASTGYIASAASYLPSLPTWSSSKTPEKPKGTSEKVTDAASQASSAQQAATDSAGDASKKVTDAGSTTVENTASTTGSAAQDTTDAVGSGAHQAIDTAGAPEGAGQLTENVVDAVGVTPKNAADIVGEGGGKAVDTAGDGVDAGVKMAGHAPEQLGKGAGVAKDAIAGAGEATGADKGVAAAQDAVGSAGEVTGADKDVEKVGEAGGAAKEAVGGGVGKVADGAAGVAGRGKKLFGL